MPGEWVVDASVLGAVFFKEPGAAAAVSFLNSDAVLLAPDLLCLEIASIAAKKVWRGEATEEAAAEAVNKATTLIPELVANADLSQRAYELAARHRFSAYDAAYLALAEARQAQFATLDAKLVRRADEEGFGGLVRLIA